MQRSKSLWGFIGLSCVMAISFLVAIAYAAYDNSSGTSTPRGDFGYNLSVDVNFYHNGGNNYNIQSDFSWYVNNQTANQISVTL